MLHVTSVLLRNNCSFSLIWFLALGYYQLMWSRKTNVIGSCDLCYRAATYSFKLERAHLSTLLLCFCALEASIIKNLASS